MQSATAGGYTGTGDPERATGNEDGPAQVAAQGQFSHDGSRQGFLQQVPGSDAQAGSRGTPALDGYSLHSPPTA